MTQTSITSRNKKFAIEVIKASAVPGDDLSFPQALGQIRVGEFVENFPMSLTFWTIDEYRRSWAEALRRLEHDREVTSCLLASVTDPTVTNFVPCWPVYREGEFVYVQNSIIFLGELDEPFNAWAPWKSVEARQLVDEDGNRISEWSTSVSEVRRFCEATQWRY